MKNFKVLFFSTLFSMEILFCLPAFSKNNFNIFLETGGVWQNRNDVQIPSNTGTRFEFDSFNRGPFLHYRLEAYYRLSNKHALRAVYAPLNIEVTGQWNKEIAFQNESFSQDEELKVRYQFNSYRLSYLYGFWGFKRDQLNLGLTAKIRQAQIAVSPVEMNFHNSYGNLGFVPLVYFEYQKALGPHWVFNCTLDGAIAPQGRAIDLALKLRHEMGKGIHLGFGVRTLEGGADNSKVFTFSWFNYALGELQIQF